MALAVYALATLKGLKRYIDATGAGKDLELEEALARASQDIEENGVGGRRLVYRGPIESDDTIMTAAALANGASAPSIANQPDTDGRTLVVKLVDENRYITAGVLTVTGTVDGAAAQTETFDLTVGQEIHGVKFFTALSALALSGVVGAEKGTATLQIGTSEGYTELFNPLDTSEIQPIEWPIQNVIELNEDLNREFGATTALTSSEYELRDASSPRRRIARIYSGLDFPFYTGHRIVRLRYSAGYRTSASVPETVRGVCLELAAWYHQHAGGQQYGLTSQTDGAGSRSFTGPPMLTSGLKDRLAAFVRPEFYLTADRDWTEPAA